MTEPADDVLAVLLLPGRLEGLAREEHARGLLSIPRVVALEPSRMRPPEFLRDALCQRQARRLRFPGRPRLLVLYHPAQYPLARALCAHHQDLELWYIPPEPETLEAADEAHKRELMALDEMARERAAQVLVASEHYVDDESLRARLRELGVINPRAFFPGTRSQWRRSRLPPGSRGPVRMRGERRTGGGRGNAKRGLGGRGTTAHGHRDVGAGAAVGRR
jgi:hypothetical protein